MMDRYRLPTKAEWEYACRAGTETGFTFGDDELLLGKYAVFQTSRTQAIGTRLPNAWGLFDLHANVWEWCQDWSGLYGEHPVHDPQGPTKDSYRVSRGGSWHYDAWYCRSAYRGRFLPSIRDFNLGFRVAFSSADQSGSESVP